MLRPALAGLFRDYANSHRHPMNRLTHKIAIPMILFHVIAMSDWLRIVEVSNGYALTGAHVGIALASAWYLRMQPRLGLMMIVVMIACLAIGWLTPGWLVVAISIVGWTIQLAGHYVWEKSSPAFFQNAIQTLVGPIFFLALVTGDWPER